jgi:uncharacterized protein YndB with AHSA1/START domain
MRWLLRILVVLAVVAAVAVLGLAIFGVREGAGRSSAEVEINRPASEIFHHITDDVLVRRWVAELTGLTHIPQAGLKVRDRLTAIVAEDGRRLEVQLIVTAVEPNRRLRFTVNSSGDPTLGFRGECEGVLNETNGHTRFSLSVDMQYFGIFTRVIEPLKTIALRKKLEADLARLKEQVEAEPPPVMPAARSAAAEH